MYTLLMENEDFKIVEKNAHLSFSVLIIQGKKGVSQCSLDPSSPDHFYISEHLLLNHI